MDTELTETFVYEPAAFYGHHAQQLEATQSLTALVAKYAQQEELVLQQPYSAAEKKYLRDLVFRKKPNTAATVLTAHSVLEWNPKSVANLESAIGKKWQHWKTLLRDGCERLFPEGGTPSSGGGVENEASASTGLSDKPFACERVPDDGAKVSSGQKPRIKCMVKYPQNACQQRSSLPLSGGSSTSPADSVSKGANESGGGDLTTNSCCVGAAPHCLENSALTGLRKSKKLVAQCLVKLGMLEHVDELEDSVPKVNFPRNGDVLTAFVGIPSGKNHLDVSLERQGVRTGGGICTGDRVEGVPALGSYAEMHTLKNKNYSAALGRSSRGKSTKSIVTSFAASDDEDAGEIVPPPDAGTGDTTATGEDVDMTPETGDAADANEDEAEPDAGSAPIEAEKVEKKKMTLLDHPRPVEEREFPKLEKLQELSREIAKYIRMIHISPVVRTDDSIDAEVMPQSDDHNTGADHSGSSTTTDGAASHRQTHATDGQAQARSDSGVMSSSTNKSAVMDDPRNPASACIPITGVDYRTMTREQLTLERLKLAHFLDQHLFATEQKGANRILKNAYAKVWTTMPKSRPFICAKVQSGSFAYVVKNPELAENGADAEMNKEGLDHHDEQQQAELRKRWWPGPGQNFRDQSKHYAARTIYIDPATKGIAPPLEIDGTVREAAEAPKDEKYELSKEPEDDYAKTAEEQDAMCREGEPLSCVRELRRFFDYEDIREPETHAMDEEETDDLDHGLDEADDDSLAIQEGTGAEGGSLDSEKISTNPVLKSDRQLMEEEYQRQQRMQAMQDEIARVTAEGADPRFRFTPGALLGMKTSSASEWEARQEGEYKPKSLIDAFDERSKVKRTYNAAGDIKAAAYDATAGAVHRNVTDPMSQYKAGRVALGAGRLTGKALVGTGKIGLKVGRFAGSRMVSTGLLDIHATATTTCGGARAGACGIRRILFLPKTRTGTKHGSEQPIGAHSAVKGFL
ncbi:unnamed protein product [Amoebophrya sp. A120]|nr:unnamed protein product [Amoebophrya sp. A120]|eukprot:GSA120T00006332001.1